MDSPSKEITRRMVEENEIGESMKRWLGQDSREEPFPAQAAAEMGLKRLEDR
jgi:hypothetical protein